MKKHIKTILLYLVVIALIIVAVSLIFNSTSKEKAKLSEIVDYFESDRVASFVIDKSYNLTLHVIVPNTDGSITQNADGSYNTEEVSYKLQSIGLFQEYCG